MSILALKMPKSNKMKDFPWINAGALAAVVLSVALIGAKNIDSEMPGQLLNVSYDPTRELYQDINRQFAARYGEETGLQV